MTASGGAALGLSPGLGAAFGLAHLPAQAGQSLGEPLAKAAIGAGHQRGARPDAAGGEAERRNGNRSAWRFS